MAFCYLITLDIFLIVLEEATIWETSGRSGTTSQYDSWHPNLIDGIAIGTGPGDGNCAISYRGNVGDRPWLSVKLNEPKKVVQVQLARRTDGKSESEGQGKNVRVQVGSSPTLKSTDPVCKEINQLSGTGLVDYECDQHHVGQYVIFSNDQVYLAICEAKVFVKNSKLDDKEILG